MNGPRRLTVLQVLPALNAGGVERGTLEVGRYLVEHGHRSIVISAGGRLVEQLTREGSEHLTWDIGRKSVWTLRLVPRLRRLLADNRIDILHARSRMPAWVAYLAWKGMHPATRPRFVTTVHGLYSVNPYSAVMVKGERVIAVSKTVRDYVLQYYPGVEPARIELIPRGVDRQEFPHGYRPPEDWLRSWQAEYPQLVGKKVLTLPGRITRLKGHEDFIELIARLKARGLPVHGLIVGGAGTGKRRYLEEMRALVARRGLEGEITFTGQRHDLREIMAVSDLVLSLSRQPESFGRTVLEALSLGIPVVGYNHGGVGEILGELYPCGLLPLPGPEATVWTQIEETVEDLLTHPSEVPTAHSYTLDKMLAETLRVYEELGRTRQP